LEIPPESPPRNSESVTRDNILFNDGSKWIVDEFALRTPLCCKAIRGTLGIYNPLKLKLFLHFTTFSYKMTLTPNNLLVYTLPVMIEVPTDNHPQQRFALLLATFEF